MACCHQHSHQPSPNSCSHHSHPPAHPPLDPLLLQSIVSLLLHHYPTPSAAAFHGSARSPLDHQSCCSDHSEHHNRKDSPPPHHPSEHVSEAKCLAHSSLLQRMDSLESSFQRFSSPSSPDTTLSLRDLAARRIQARFRAFLVHRSRAFRRLKELTAINSTVDKIKSVDSSSVPPPEIIEDRDEMAVDSKRLIVRAFAEFLEQVEGIFVRGNGVSSKTIKDFSPVRNDEKSKVSKESDVVGHVEKGSEYCNLDKNGKPLTNNLRENVRRRFREIFEDVKDEDEGRHWIVAEDESGNCRGAENHNRLQSNAVKHVRFIEDENATKVHVTDGSLTDSTSTVSGDVKKIEDTVEKQQDDMEMNSDGKKNPAESVEGSEDEAETENENEDCEDDETENEGSGDEYESENEECEEDEDEAENEGSEEEYETENEVCEEEEEDDEDETEYEEEEEEGSEIEDETENGSNSNIPQDNKNNVNAEVVNLPMWGEHNLVKKRDMRNVICHICFKRGHMKMRCWYNPTMLCNKCHMIGHAQQVCGIVRKQLSQTSDS